MTSAISNIEIYTPVYDKYYSDVDMTSTLFPITDQCERNATIMGEDYVRLVFNLKDRISFDAFSFIMYDGQTFFLREQYTPTPNGTMQEGTDVSSHYYSYDVKFVSVANMLDKHVCYRHVVVSGENGGEWYEPEININGTLETLYVIIMGAIKRAAEQLKGLYYGYLLNTIYQNGMAADGINPNLANVKLTSGTKLLTFNFSGDNIANVCTTVANNFTNDDKKDTEWYITEQMGAGDSSLTLHFAKCISENGEQMFTDYTYKDKGAYAFAHPIYTGGLKNVEYAQTWSGVTNTIVPYGSERNMTYEAVKGIDAITNMQSTFGKRLRLLPNTTYNVTDKDGSPATIVTDENGAIHNDLVNTGIEQVKFFDDIYPQGHFKVVEVTQRNKRQDGQTIPEYTILATPIDSAGNDIPEESVPSGFYPIQIEEGATLSVRFESGLLNGREFEIANKTKSELKIIMGEQIRVYSLAFTIVADGSLEDGTLIPSGNFIPRAADGSYEGDRFALFNMKMPQVYIDQARNELAQRAYEELLDIQTTRPEVKCTTDPVNFNGFVGFGDVMRISSELFNSADYQFVSRVIKYSYKLSRPTEAEFSLASAVMQGTLSSMNDLIADVTHATGGLEQRAINLSRRAWRDASEVAEMLDSITAEMMLVGNERYQFAYTSGIECIDVSNKFDSLKIGTGTIQHTQEPYISYGNAGFWYVSEQYLNTDEVGGALDKDTAYYLYAKVADDQAPAEMVLSTTYYDTNDSYLLFGILSSEFEDRRVFSRTNGFTAIEGGTITTEQIQDASRQLIIDFQSNPPRIIARGGAKITGNIEFDLTQEQIDDILGKLEIPEIGQIGGENLLPNTALHHKYNVGDTLYLTKLINLEAGKKYVATYGKFENNAGGATNEVFNDVCLAIGTAGSLENIEMVVNFGEPFDVNYNGRELYLAWALGGYVNEVKGTSPNVETTTTFTQYLDEVMVQEGEVATSFQPYVEHITNALEGSTEVAGGLVMTNLLMLKDESGKVTAGMSGLRGTASNPENILWWGGGDYSQALASSQMETPTINSLMKKDGTGKIGILKIGDEKVEIDVPNHGLISIDASNSGESGICISKGSDIRTIITDLNIEDVATRRKSTKSVMGINFSEKDVLPDEDIGDMITRLYFNVSGTPTAIELTSVKLKFYTEPTSGVIPTSVKYDVTGFIMVNTDKVSALWDDQYQINHSFRQSDIVNNCYECVLSFPKISRTDFIGNLRFIEISLGVGSTNTASQVFTKCDIEVEGMVWLGSTLELARESIIVGCDGISCINGQSRFQIRNTNYGQIIIVDGLPTSSEGLKKGQLWNNNGVLSIF